MQHAVLVGVVDGAGRLLQVDGGGAAGQGVGRNALGEAAAADVLHAEVRLALVRAGLVQGDDAGVLQLGGGGGLGVEAVAVVGVGESAAEDHLQGDGAVEADVAGLEDDAHAAAADLLDEFVVGEAVEGEAADVRDGPGLGAELAGAERVGGRAVGGRTLGGPSFVDGGLVGRPVWPRNAVVGTGVAHSLCLCPYRLVATATSVTGRGKVVKQRPCNTNPRRDEDRGRVSQNGSRSNRGVAAHRRAAAAGRRDP